MLQYQSEESQNSTTKLIGETHKNMLQIYNSYWYLLSGCYGQAMVSKSDQRWNFKYLMLMMSTTSHNIQIPYYHALTRWLLVTKGNQ